MRRSTARQALTHTAVLPSGVAMLYRIVDARNYIFSVSLENTARMETMAKKRPMNSRGFQIGVARRLFRGPTPFVVPILITSSRKSKKIVIP
jgi:hypothetical protein